jgi:hypothetical protein
VKVISSDLSKSFNEKKIKNIEEERKGKKREYYISEIYLRKILSSGINLKFQFSHLEGKFGF